MKRRDMLRWFGGAAASVVVPMDLVGEAQIAALDVGDAGLDALIFDISPTESPLMALVRSGQALGDFEWITFEWITDELSPPLVVADKS